MRPLATATFLLALAVTQAASQPAPFDMAPERPRTEPVRPAPPAPAPSSSQNAAAQPPRTQAKRYLIPFSNLTLTGEIDRRSWSVYLTPEQSAAPATLNLGYRNAIVAAPEFSRLRIMINGVALIEEPIRAPEQVAEATVRIPPGLLKTGPNTISLQSTMRHRTDCTIQSTYELWTEIDPTGTFLSFDAPETAGLRRLEDIAAIGTDSGGATRFDLVVPAMDLAATTGPIIRLAQGLAITANMPNQFIDVSAANVEGSGPGRLKIVVGTPAELESLPFPVPEGAGISPVAAFVKDPRSGASTLVISGPTWPALQTAIENVTMPLDRSPNELRTTLVTSTWRLPDAQIFRGKGAVPFADLDVPTQEFAGRRFRTDFIFGIPSDFYADAYGEATILLDAAYSAEVLPGSHVDVYVNGNIAATVPITQAGGGILRQLPVTFTMRHFRPGVNTIALEAVLLTQADTVCLPGTTGNEAPRFAIFDTSQFVMPDFARTARRPDLAGIAGTGFPYSRAPGPIALIADQTQPQTLSAAATMMARMSVAAGRPIPVDATMSPGALGDRDAIFVGAIADMPPHLLTQLGVDPESRKAWGGAPVATSLGNGDAQTQATFERWREELSGRGWQGRVSQFEDWLYRNFGLSLGTLRLAPRAAPAFMPSGNLGLIMAQQSSPSGARTWTMVSAPNPSLLGDGMRILGTQEGWNRIGGQITTVDVADRSVERIPVATFDFFATQPPSFTNYRLIAANWLSANTLSFAAALFALCVLLGLATSILLSVFGRQK